MMLYRNLLLLIFLCFGGLVSGQLPEDIIRKQSSGTEGGKRSCGNQDAGTIAKGTFTGQSNDTDDQIIFLCRGDQIQFTGGRDANFDGDPDPVTNPGVGYAFYDCPPTVTGPGISDIENDPCKSVSLNPNAELTVTRGFNPEGDINIVNNQATTSTLENFFGVTMPLQYWFAPITLDQFTPPGGGTDYFEGNPQGECAIVSVDEAFSIVYLNAIEQVNFSTPTPDALNGSFTLRGGLPEFDGSNYNNVVIELVSNPSVTANITNGPNFGHNSTLQFTVPQPGQYRLRAADGKGCPLDHVFSMPNNTVNLVINAPAQVEVGEFFCVEVRLGNLVDIISLSFSVNWDPTVLRFTGINTPNPHPLPNFDPALNVSTTGEVMPVTRGRLGFFWFDDSTENPVSWEDDELVLEICFEAIGDPGDNSFISFTSNNPTVLEFENESSTIVGTNITNANVEIINPTTLTISARSCSTTGTDGAIFFRVFGGDGPYSYTLELGPTIVRTGNFPTGGIDVEISPLPPGDYVLTVTDNSGQIAFRSVVVVNSVRVFVETRTVVNPRCFGQTNGRINVEPAGGQGPYTYEWSNGIFGSPEIRQLGSGSYTVTVTDANGCSVEETFSLGVIPVTATFDTVNPTCNGVRDGSITAIPAGGTGPYAYLWSTTPPGQMATVTDLGPGTYNVTVQDNNNCTHTASVTLNPTKVINLTGVVSGPTCRGDTDAMITVTAAATGGPDLNYTFQWTPNLTDTGSSPQSIVTNLAPGDYQVQATDDIGCIASASFTVINPSELRLIQFVNNEDSCSDDEDTGTLTVIPQGGTGSNYQIVWNDGEFTGNNLENIPAGEYRVTVTDENGCTADTVFYVGPTALFNVLTESCEGQSDGSIEMRVIWGTSYTVAWSTGATTENITGLTAGMYTVTITGDDGCIKIFEVELPVTDRIMITEDHILPTCPGFSDGQIRIEVEGGIPPYSFEWQHTGVTTPNLTNQRAGNYVLFISDQSGCDPVRFDIVLPQPPLIMFRFYDIQSLTCADSDCDGSAMLDLTMGSVPGGTFNVVWNNGNNFVSGVTTLELTDLCLGENLIEVTDENGCPASNTVPIFAPDPIEIDLDNSVIEDVSCFGDTDGSATILAAGGTGPYTYSWPELMVNGNTINDVAPDGYNIQVTDANGCIFQTEIIIGEPEQLLLNIDNANTFDIGCAGLSDGQITVIPVGGNPGDRTFTWSPNVSTTSVATGLSEGVYSVTVVDSKGCEASVSRTISQPPPIIVNLPAPEPPRCFGLETFININSVSGGAGGPFTYSVNNGPQVPVSSQFPTLAGNISIRIFDSRGCTFDTTLIISEPPPVFVSLGDDITIDLGDTITLRPFIQSSLPITDFDWMPATDLSCGDCENPDAFPGNTTMYELLVTDQNGCTGEDDILITVSKRRFVYIPNAFTPDGDGINDVFRVFTGKGVTSINHMRIYDRWGNLMFNREDLPLDVDNGGSEGWTGEYRGRLVDGGVYVYTVEVSFIDGAVLLYRGEVAIYR
jgi:gliding motility-associated-like protein